MAGYQIGHNVDDLVRGKHAGFYGGEIKFAHDRFDLPANNPGD